MTPPATPRFSRNQREDSSPALHSQGSYPVALTARVLHPLRVLLVDDQKLIRFTVRAFCKALSLLAVVGEAENGQQAVEQVDRLTPDLVLMDADLPVLDGLEAARRIMRQHPDTAIIMFCAQAENDRVREALKAGARGYILKDELSETSLTHAVQVVEAGGLFFDTRTGTGLLRSFSAGQPAFAGRA